MDIEALKQSPEFKEAVDQIVDGGTVIGSTTIFLALNNGQPDILIGNPIFRNPAAMMDVDQEGISTGPLGSPEQLRHAIDIVGNILTQMTEMLRGALERLEDKAAESVRQISAGGDLN